MTYRFARVALKVVLPALTVFVALHVLYSAWCAFSHHFFSFRDYGIYTNMIYNSGHGAFYRYALEQSYLYIHLSFTLALLGPLFYIWNHPFLLAAVQWLMLLGGGAVLYRTARKRGLAWETAWAAVFFLLAYRLTQSAMVKEFHGLAAYFILVPWLYHALSYKQKTAWIPLVLILGVREDAFIFLLPMLGYFAVRNRNRTAILMLVGALVYGALAILVLYPWINGVSLFESRARFLGMKETLAAGEQTFSAVITRRHLRALAMTLLPVLVFLGRGMLPVLLFPSFALFTALFSSCKNQQTLGMHYGIAVVTMLSVALIESAWIKRQREDTSTPALLRAYALMVLVILVHLESGFIIGGAKCSPTFYKPHRLIHLKMNAARSIPKDGVLITEANLSTYTANRKDLLIFDLYDEGDCFDHVFMQMASALVWKDGWIYEMYENGELEVTYYDGFYVVFERGAASDPGISLPANLSLLPVLCTFSYKHGGEEGYTPELGIYRYWEGDGSRGPINICFGTYRELQPGRYDAVFSFHARKPRRDVRHSWGWLSLHEMDHPESIAEQEIVPVATRGIGSAEQVLSFEISKPTRIEPRVTGADAELWLDRVTFVRKP